MGGMEIGYNSHKYLEDAFYNYWFLEPQIKVNIGNSAYLAFVYRYISGIYESHVHKDQKTHWFNLRVCYSF